MDGLKEEERALAWAATWNPSFTGIAIVNKDFTFRSVNEQFCSILGTSPAALLGRRFQDVTPSKVKEMDEKNAKLIMDGTITTYLLPKSYEIEGAPKVDVLLLVSGVFRKNGEFLFFVSKIIKAPEARVYSPLQSPSQKQTSSALKVIAGWMKWEYLTLVAAGALALGAFIRGLMYR